MILPHPTCILVPSRDISPSIGISRIEVFVWQSHHMDILLGEYSLTQKLESTHYHLDICHREFLKDTCKDPHLWSNDPSSIHLKMKTHSQTLATFMKYLYRHWQILILVAKSEQHPPDKDRHTQEDPSNLHDMSRKWLSQILIPCRKRRSGVFQQGQQ